MNGWAVAKRIVQISNNVLQVQQGSLYPASHRLEQRCGREKVFANCR
jgi:PadR family transcriptional regulator, regulatory protein PadR